MSILSITTDVPGQIGVTPRRVKITCTDSLSTVTTAGYLNSASRESFVFYTTDVVDMIYSYNTTSHVGTYEVFTTSISNGVITLTQWTNPGDVLLPVTSGDIAIFNGTSGQIKDGSIASTNIVVKNATNTMAAGSSIVLAKSTGNESSNAVTVNAQAGVITTSSLTTGGGDTYAITWTNSFIASTSAILLTIMGGSNSATENITLTATAGSGTSTLTIYNNTASTALNGTLLIGFLVV